MLHKKFNKKFKERKKKKKKKKNMDLFFKQKIDSC